MSHRLKKSVRKFRQFNRRDPRELVPVDIDLKTPLILLGAVPEITYISSKEGTRSAYKHATSSPMPVLYAHPDGKFFLMLGGNVKVKGWLHD